MEHDIPWNEDFSIDVRLLQLVLGWRVRKIYHRSQPQGHLSGITVRYATTDPKTEIPAENHALIRC